MKSALWNTALFVSVPLGLGVLADLMLAVFYQGGQLNEVFSLHAVLFASIIVLCGLGAFTSFMFLRGYSTSRNSVLLNALLFAVASFFAMVFAFGLGGPVALGAWLFLGAAGFAAVASLSGGRHTHGV